LERIQGTKSQPEKEVDLREIQEAKMALTRDFKETIKKRVQCDPDFAKSLLHEAVDLMLDGDSATAKLILRDLINATVGFERLAEEVKKPSKSLHRMLSTSGNPTMENLSTIFATIKKTLHVRIDTTVTAV
jgi:DNA-binding phage protein